MHFSTIVRFHLSISLGKRYSDFMFFHDENNILENEETLAEFHYLFQTFQFQFSIQNSIPLLQIVMRLYFSTITSESVLIGKVNCMMLHFILNFILHIFAGNLLGNKCEMKYLAIDFLFSVTIEYRTKFCDKKTDDRIHEFDSLCK